MFEICGLSYCLGWGGGVGWQLLYLLLNAGGGGGVAVTLSFTKCEDAPNFTHMMDGADQFILITHFLWKLKVVKP